MKIIDTMWFTEMDSTRPIGIVLGVDETTGEYKAYIGTGEGVDEQLDAEHIAEHGAKFPLLIAAKGWPLMEGWGGAWGKGMCVGVDDGVRGSK